MKVKFDDSSKVYALKWTDLLTEGGLPFETLDSLSPGTKVSAPYSYGEEDVAGYAPAVIAGPGKKPSAEKGQ